MHQTSRLRLGVLVAAAVVAAATPAAAGPQRVWAKADTTGVAMQRDLDECVQESKDVHANVSTVGYYGGGGLAGALGAAIGAAIVAGIEEHSARGGYIRRCMHARGYYGVVMSGDELDAAKLLKTSDERAAWADRTYATAGFPERLKMAMRPPVPQLPEGRLGPGDYRSIHLEMTSLTTAPGIVSPGQTVLTGSARHLRTAKLRDGFMQSNIELPAGTVMYQMVGPSDEDPNQTFWCSQTRIHALLGVNKMSMCFWTDDDGYAADWADGPVWVSKDIMLQVAPRRMPGGAILLDQSDDDLVGRMDVTLVVSKIGKAAVSVQAKASLNGKSTLVWSGNVPFDADGKARVPFWTRRLVLTRSGTGVTAEWSDDGDGKGWESVASAG